MRNLQKFKARPYQEECLVKIAETVANGEKRALVVMASGLGKTVTSAMAAEQFFAQRAFGRVLVLCHSEEILSQSKAKYKLYFGEEYSYGMYTGNEKTTRATDFLFATFQTMKEHRKQFQKDAFAYVIVDEAHHSHASTYAPTIRYFKPEFLLGLTATPDRLDGQNIEEIYGAPVYELDFVEAMSRGLLAECDYQLVLDDISQERLNEYIESDEKISIAQLNRTIFLPKRDEEIVRLIREYSAEQENPKTIIFCKSIEHARRIAKLIGEEAVLVHNGQTNLANDMALEAFRCGKIRTIISVQMLNEGIDVPDANIIVFLRNTVSETIFYQQLGRGTRLSPGKDKVKVLDFVANCERIRAVLELKRDLDDFKLQQPVSNAKPHGAGDADSREKFTLDIATPEFSTKMVDIVKLLNGRHWDIDGIVSFLQGLSLELGRSPHISDMRTYDGAPNLKTIIRLCGSFNHAIELAGLTPFSRLSAEHAIELLKENAADGFLPRRNFFDNSPELPWSSAIMRALEVNRWADVAKVTGLKLIDSTGETLSENEYDEIAKYHLCLYYEESLIAMHWLTATEIDQNKRLKNTAFFLKYFKNMHNMRNRAIELCCSSEDELKILTDNGRSESRKAAGRSSIGIGIEYILTNIQRLTRELRHKPTMRDINNCEYLPKYSYIRARVGNLQKLYEICEVDKILLSMGIQGRASRGAIESKSRRVVFQILADGTPYLLEKEKQLMQDYVRKVGRKLKKRDLCSQNGLPSEASFRYYNLNMDDVNSMIDADTILAELNN